MIDKKILKKQSTDEATYHSFQLQKGREENYVLDFPLQSEELKVPITKNVQIYAKRKLFYDE